MRRALVLAVLAGAACRPDSFDTRIKVHVPQADTRPLPPSWVPHAKRVEVPRDSHPRVLRPQPTVEVKVPAHVPLPKGMRSK